MRTGSVLRPVHPRVPSEAEATIARLCLRRSGADQQAIAGRTTCPVNLNAWGKPRAAVSAGSQIFRRFFTAIFRLFVAHLGALIEGAQTGSFHGRDVHKNIFTALIGLNKSIALSGVKPLHNTGRHTRAPFCNHPEPSSLGG